MALVGLAALGAPSCFDRSTRWEHGPGEPPPPLCVIGAERCTRNLERCEEGVQGPAWAIAEDCMGRGLVCAPSLLRCAECLPNARACDGQDVVTCLDDGTPGEVLETCDVASGRACRSGTCPHLCQRALVDRSNVGCEYWAVDLDNAMISATSNAAAQQYAVVVSNAQPDVPATVRIFQDDGAPGDPGAPVEIATAVIAPLNLQVFKLGPREVDGSAPGSFNTGTHTALTRAAYKIETSFPVVAYQFNPLENVNVFSNDASLLKPREALNSGGALQMAYVALGWPQTIAHTDDPNTNFNPQSPIHLRAFLTIVGTTENTTVRVTTRAAVVGGGPVPATAAGGVIEATLGPFDVLNLETGGFNADFTGSIIHADRPVAVFSGGEASDAPHFPKLSERRCCADHVEEQLDPLRTAGRRFAVPHTPSRTRAVREAGAPVEEVPEPDFVRIVSASSEPVVVKTTLPPPHDAFELGLLGDFRELVVTDDFLLEASGPVHVGQVMPSQDAAGVKRGLPGGDPSLLIVPPVEQYRHDYVFLTPDKYAFDFVSVVAPSSALVLLDDTPIGPDRCEVTPALGPLGEGGTVAGPSFVVYRCQLGFPLIDPDKQAPDNVLPGVQHDGVHRVMATEPVGLFVTGFDSYVSYSYAAGTELREIAPPL